MIEATIGAVMGLGTGLAILFGLWLGYKWSQRKKKDL